MAASRKYAGLPDLDPAPEIYETPDLTEDGSTEQTSTLRTESPTLSEDGRKNEYLDHARLNQDEARRRFEPTVVNTKGANLSEAIGGIRQGYKTRHRTRRRKIGVDRHGDEFGQYGDVSEDSGEEEETLSKKLARLRREAEEVRLELARRETEADFQDTVEHQQGNETAQDDRGSADGIGELRRLLDGLEGASRSATKGETLEQEFRHRIATEKPDRKDGRQTETSTADTASTTSPSARSAITAFSDRLTALETALGVSSTAPSTTLMSVLPTLETLNTHIMALRNTISPPQTVLSNSQKDQIDILTSRMHTLHADADSLLNTRKAAMQALAQLQEARHRGSNSAVFARYRREARQRESFGTGVDEEAVTGEDGNRPSLGQRARSDQKRASHTQDAAVIEDKVFTDVFLEEQSAKIAALHSTLPTIQSLQPLLPVVLERLRGLSVVHASASTASNDMAEIESRLRDSESELKKWREAVEGVEKGIEEVKDVMRENVDVVSGMVKGVEERMKSIEQGRK